MRLMAAWTLAGATVSIGCAAGLSSSDDATYGEPESGGPTDRPADPQETDGSAGETGTPVVSTGTRIVDAGTLVVDAGTPVVDAGPMGNSGTTQDASVGACPAGTLPFVVDSQYVSSGYMGDVYQVSVTPAKDGDTADCSGNRATGAVGKCHTIVYQVVAAGSTITPPAGGTADPGVGCAGKNCGWAGVYWQYPANNWGDVKGYPIPPGATKVTFQARGEKGGETVNFIAGYGPSGTAKSYKDNMSSKTTAKLDTTWKSYSLDFTGQSYADPTANACTVLGAFGWTVDGQLYVGTTVRFYIDDIRYVQ